MTNSVAPKVDLVVLSRDSGSLHPEVEVGLLNQRGVQSVVHRVVGQAQPDDSCRYETIARGRNEGKLRGVAPWIMFVDDDVVLDPECVRTLVDELSRRPAFAALAADYLGEHRDGEIAGHVSMGATLFRREALDQICFVYHTKQCECKCCCDDLRRLHWGIDYYGLARATHLSKNKRCQHATANSAPCGQLNEKSATGRVLTAFNRRHLRPFRTQFLHTLRATGNDERVIPLAIGLNRRERRRLRSFARVTPFFRIDDGRKVARQRLRGFDDIVRKLPPNAFVAYWDAADVIFQGRLKPLWELVRAHPDQLLVAREPMAHPESPTITAWTRGIIDSAERRRVRELLYPRPWLNGGFVAGTARALSKYFRTVADWYDTPRLAGSCNRGDQLALNVYCHSNPHAWHEVSESWNYCLCRRDLKTVYRNEDGRYIDVRGVPIYAVHGNARTLNAVPIRRAPHLTFRGSLAQAN